MFFLVWILLIAASTHAWVRYDAQPGAVSREDTAAEAPGTYRIILFLHPHCPCSRSILGDVARLAQSSGHAAHVLVCKPASAQGECWDTIPQAIEANRSPLVSIRWDEDGAHAREMGAATSGHLLVLAPDGSKIYSGGITRRRGGKTDPALLAEVQTRLLGTCREPLTPPVFGCPLRDEHP